MTKLARRTCSDRSSRSRSSKGGSRSGSLKTFFIILGGQDAHISRFSHQAHCGSRLVRCLHVLPVDPGARPGANATVRKHHGVIWRGSEQFLAERLPECAKRGERGEEPRLNFQEEGPGQFHGGNSLPFRRHAHTCAGNSKCQCAEYGGSACSTCPSRNSRQFDASRGGSHVARLRAMATSFGLAQPGCSRRPTRPRQASGRSRNPPWSAP